MGAVRDNNFFVVHGWMINQLGLKGSELELYAIIYGFSQAKDTEFTGSLQYLSDWVGLTRQNTCRRLQSLVEKGLLIKTDVFTNGVKTCKYTCVVETATGVLSKQQRGIAETATGCCRNSNGGIAETATNIIPDIHTDNISDNKEGGQAPTQPAKKSAKKVKADAEAVLARYTSDPATLELLRDWLKVRKAKRAPETEKALTLNLDKLQAMAKESGLSVPAYLEAVIMRGWAAFFPIREAAQRPGGGFHQPPERSRIKTEDEYEAAMRASGFGWG